MIEYSCILSMQYEPKFFYYYYQPHNYFDHYIVVLEQTGPGPWLVFDYCADLQQNRLLRLGAVPRLVSVLLQYCENEALLSSCLLALCNLADMGEEDGSTLVWERRGHFDEEVHVFHGTLQHSFGFVSTATVVQLNQWSQGQYSVRVEVVQKCSTLLWKEHNRRQTGWRLLSFTCLGFFPKLYKFIKYSVRNIPKNRSRLKTAVFHTFL